MLLLLVGFILGVIAVVTVEAAGLLYLLRRLNQKTTASTSSVESSQSLDPRQSLDYALNKQVLHLIGLSFCYEEHFSKLITCHLLEVSSICCNMQ